MVSKFQPKLNQVFFIDRPTMFHILSGLGHIEVDFSSYQDWQDKLIFLEKGQYIKFISDDFTVRKVEFDNEELFESKDVRVLFKHLVSLGYIDFNECEDCQRYLNSSVFSEEVSKIIDVSSEQWFWQNPFQANRDEYHVIFDIKDIIDKEFKADLSSDKISRMIGIRGHDAQLLFKDKIGLSVKSALSQKRILESKKDVAFSQKSIKEIAFEFGFKDPAYFNRVFSKVAGQSPGMFRDSINYESQDSIFPELYSLLEKHHKEHRAIDFYANKMNLSVKSLSKTVKDELNITLGQLVRTELINTARLLLHSEISIKEIAFELGFEEANHFSSFFKHYTDSSPTQYRESMNG